MNEKGFFILLGIGVGLRLLWMATERYLPPTARFGTEYFRWLWKALIHGGAVIARNKWIWGIATVCFALDRAWWGISLSRIPLDHVKSLYSIHPPPLMVTISRSFTTLAVSSPLMEVGMLVLSVVSFGLLLRWRLLSDQDWVSVDRSIATRRTPMLLSGIAAALLLAYAFGGFPDALETWPMVIITTILILVGVAALLIMSFVRAAYALAVRQHLVGQPLAFRPLLGDAYVCAWPLAGFSLILYGPSTLNSLLQIYLVARRSATVFPPYWLSRAWAMVDPLVLFIPVIIIVDQCGL